MDKMSNNKVFIVHGHDSLKAEVELFLTKLGLEPIILHKQCVLLLWIMLKNLEILMVSYM